MRNWSNGRYVLANNLYWDTEKPMPSFLGDRSLEQWRMVSKDTSVVADPRFANVAERDFRLAPDSHALALGLRPFKTGQPGHTGRQTARRLPVADVPRAWPAP